MISFMYFFLHGYLNTQVRWEFIFSCLRGIEVPELYLRWLKACICTSSFSVGFNGNMHGYFKGLRGLRQGDPLSPYLFVLAMNCLSVLLDKAAEEGKFQYHHNCHELKLTHLCFADDLLIFLDGTSSSVQNVLQVLKEFEAASSLAISLPKTSFSTSGIPQAEIDQIKAVTGISHGQLPIRYLGLPLCTKKLTLLNCAPLTQKVKSRFNAWSTKTLSFAGRLQLLNSVIAGISNFWCSAFVLPKKCIEILRDVIGL